MAKYIKSLGAVVRSLGKAIDSIGVGVQGKYAYIEKLTPALTMVPYTDKKPILSSPSFIAPNSTIIGDVKIGQKSSIWYGAILRGDVNAISIGENTNIQDNVVIHVARFTPEPCKPRPTIIGNNVSIGHGSVIHACNIADNCLVGMGSTLLDGSKMESMSIVGAGSMVKPDTVVPTGEIWVGIPAHFHRKLTEEEKAFLMTSASNYTELAEQHHEENAKTFDQVAYDKVLRQDRLERDPDYDAHLGVERDPKTREIKYMAPI